MLIDVKRQAITPVRPPIEQVILELNPEETAVLLRALGFDVYVPKGGREELPDITKPEKSWWDRYIIAKNKLRNDIIKAIQA